MLIKTKLAVTTTREGARDAETLYIKFLTAEKASIYRLDVAFPVLETGRWVTTIQGEPKRDFSITSTALCR
jgi:hypothetical protein